MGEKRGIIQRLLFGSNREHQPSGPMTQGNAVAWIIGAMVLIAAFFYIQNEKAKDPCFMGSSSCRASQAAARVANGPDPYR